MKRSLLIFFLHLVLAGGLLAAPYGEKGKAVQYVQPDGSVIDLRVFGDEFYAVTETLDGYTVVFDPATKAYVYADLSTDGNTFSSTGQLVGKTVPKNLSVSKHLRINPPKRKAKAKQRFERWDKGMGVRARWESLKASRRAAEASAMAEASGAGATDAVVMAPPSSTTIGNKVGLTLLIDFDDDPATVPQEDIQAFCNAANYTGYGNNGSVWQYFHDNSNGQLSYSNVVTVYIRIPNSLHPKSWYNDTSKDCGDQGNLLVRDAISIMTNLPNYTTEILPALNNLTVDGNNRAIACNVFYAGGNGGVWSYGLWPHSWSLYNVGAQYLSPGGKKIFKYQITDIGSSLELGTFCHENGHMLCDYPDIYDYDYDSIGGAGKFCLMNSGGHGKNPVQICAYLKLASGWATTVDLDSSSMLIASVSSAGADFNRFYRYMKPGVNTEYYLIENRQIAGRDANLPAAGVAIWHIDELGDKDDQRMEPNTSHQNYEVTLVQADNLWHFQNDVNSGDSNDLYHENNTAAAYSNQFDDDTIPHSHWWDGTPSGISFRDFSENGSTMTFIVSKGPVIAVNPTHLVLQAMPGLTGNAHLVISNSGLIGLNFTLSDDLSDDNYSWSDSGEAGGPVFDWIDITSDYTGKLILGDAGESPPLDIGFDFPFYGTVYTQLQIAADGGLLFDFGDLASFNTTLPAATNSVPGAALLPFWDDLYDLMGGGRYYYKSESNRFIVTFHEIPRTVDLVEHPNTFQTILYSDGRIIFQYLDMQGAVDNCTVGVQAGPSGPASQIAYNTAFITNGLAIDIQPPLDWISYAPTSGVLTSGAATSVLFTAEAGVLPTGVYECVATVIHNDPLQNSVSIPISFTILEGDPGDTDADGLPDTWETQHFGDLDANPGDAAANGINTVRESYIAGLNPTNATSILTLSNLQNVVWWNAASSRVYRVWWSSNLLAAPFTLLQSNLTTGAFTDSTHSAETKGFYRIEVELVP